jgi:hypothetical protein
LPSPSPSPTLARHPFRRCHRSCRYRTLCRPPDFVAVAVARVVGVSSSSLLTPSPSSSPATLVAVAIARLIVVSLSPSPLGSKSSSSSPPRPPEPTNCFDVVVAGSSVVVAPAIPLPSTQSRALTAPVARRSRRRRRRRRRQRRRWWRDRHTPSPTGGGLRSYRMAPTLAVECSTSDTAAASAVAAAAVHILPTIGRNNTTVRRFC